jgi:hypothetical protein
MPLIIINGQQARISPNRLERQFDELQLDLMRALEAAGIEVITEDGSAKTTLGDMLNDEFEQEAAERAWVRSKWDGRL